MSRFDWLQDPEIEKLFAIFRDAGSELRFVGGAVRDSILNLPIKDLDAASPLPPQEMMKTLGRAGLKVIPTGIDHGTVTVVLANRNIEITTLRCDVTTDGRRAEVAYTDNWQEDAARRDFTFNALYIDDGGHVMDYFNGQDDLKNGVVRFIGEPEQRITEDFLRILRFFRFYGRFGESSPDAKGLAACKALAENLKKLSRERIRDELMKILVLDRALETCRLMQDNGVFPPLFDAAGDIGRLTSVIEAEQALGLAPDPVRRLYALDPSSSRTLQSRFALSNKQAQRIDAVQADWLTQWHLKPPHEMFYHLDTQRLEDLLVTLVAEKQLPAPEAAALLDAFAGFQRPEFPINGHDLAAIGFKGPELGQKLKSLENQWIGSHFKLSREELLSL